jgi:hypothetical protein
MICQRYLFNLMLKLKRSPCFKVGRNKNETEYIIWNTFISAAHEGINDFEEYINSAKPPEIKSTFVTVPQKWIQFLLNRRMGYSNCNETLHIMHFQSYIIWQNKKNKIKNWSYSLACPVMIFNQNWQIWKPHQTKN